MHGEMDFTAGEERKGKEKKCILGEGEPLHFAFPEFRDKLMLGKGLNPSEIPSISLEFSLTH